MGNHEFPQPIQLAKKDGEEPTWDSLYGGAQLSGDEQGRQTESPQPSTERKEQTAPIKNEKKELAEVSMLESGIYNNVALTPGKKISIRVPYETKGSIVLGASEEAKKTNESRTISFSVDKDGLDLRIDGEATAEGRAMFAWSKKNHNAAVLYVPGTAFDTVHPGEEIIIGRNFDRLPISDEFSRVSRKHLAIRCIKYPGMVGEGSFFFEIEDLGSGNGGYMNFSVPREEAETIKHKFHDNLTTAKL